MAYQPHIEDALEVLSEEEVIALMPKSFVFIAELLGVESALEMIKSYGGSFLFIPSKHALTIKHDIAGVIGLKKFQSLSEQFGGQKIEVPMGTSITTHMRNRLIQSALDKGESQARIARNFGVTPRTVRTARRAKIKPQELDNNLDLFK